MTSQPLMWKLFQEKNSKALCSGCGRTATLYDKLKTRRFEFVPLWGYPVFFNYQMRRVNCKRCSIVVEAVPWASGKHTLTKTYMQFLSSWARKLSWSETARSFQTSWRKGFDSVRFVVDYGLKNRDVSIGHRPNYLTFDSRNNTSCKAQSAIDGTAQYNVYGLCNYSTAWLIILFLEA